MHGAASLRARRCGEWGTGERGRQWPEFRPPGAARGNAGFDGGSSRFPNRPKGESAQRPAAEPGGLLEMNIVSRGAETAFRGRAGLRDPKPVRESAHRFYSISERSAVNTASPSAVLSGLSTVHEGRGAGHGAGQPRLVDDGPEVEPEKMVVVDRPGFRGDAASDPVCPEAAPPPATAGVRDRSSRGRGAVRPGFRYLPATGMARG